MTEAATAPDVREIDSRRLIRRIFLVCIAIQVYLVVADWVFNYLDVFDDLNMRRIWNIAREQSVPSWFSSIQTQLLGVTVLLIGAVRSSVSPRWKTAGWVLAGLFFIWLGIDDYAEIHEKLGGVLERMGQDGGPGWTNPSFSWHTYIAPFYALCSLLIAAGVALPFWRQGLLPYLVLGFGLWAVAQGIDFVEGLDEAEDLYDWFQDAFGIERRYGVTHTMKLLEEMMEMFGTTLLWVGFLHYLGRASDGLGLRLRYGAGGD